MTQTIKIPSNKWSCNWVKQPNVSFCVQLYTINFRKSAGC